MEPGSTRERLIRITADELARRGYRGLSLRGVAARAGIGPATVFHHFPEGKQGLYEATVAHVVAEMTALANMTERDLEGATPAEVILLRAERFWDLMAAKPELAAMMLHESFEVEPRDGDLLQAHAGTVIQYAVGFVEDAQQRGDLADFDPRRFLLWCALHIIGYHGAPRVKLHLFGDGRGEEGERTAFLAMVRAYLEGRMPGGR